jgi:Insertion element 4 transposase N-terminal/Transposase DDE domain
MLSDALPLVIELPNPPDWRRLGEHLPCEWVEAALAASDKATIRQRRLPAQQVVWLVIALALYRRKSVKEIVDTLDLALPELADRCITSSATTQARQRVGSEPLKWLFEKSAQQWIAQDQDRFLFHGLNLLAMDGTTLRLADSAANREHFGAQNYANSKVASYPQARGVTLMMVATQIIRDARFGTYQTSETAYAHELLPSVPDDSLTVIDRGFFSAQLLCNLVTTGRNRHFLIPAKSNTKWTLIKGEGDEVDGLVEMTVSDAARKKDPSLPKTWRARALRVVDAKGKISYLLTSLTDRKAYKAADLIACYSRRWRIETSYRELKHSMMGSALTLRSMTVDGTEQEIWGAMIAYNLIRVEIAKAALEAKCEPTEISFTLALMTIQNELLMIGPATAQGNLPAILKRLRERLVLDLKAQRPGRKFDRVVKAVAQRYPEKRLTKKSLT